MNRILATFASWATLSLVQAANGDLLGARWLNRTLGPDGPWNAISVMLGNGQDVTVYPGKMWESYFLGESYCQNTTVEGQPCYAQEAGAIYNESAGFGNTADISFPAGASYTSNMVATGNDGTRYIDNMYLGNVASVWADDQIENFDMVLMSNTRFQYPSGKQYPIFAGCLSFGAARSAANQTFQTVPGQAIDAVNVSLLAGTLYRHERIGSETFGMHIGSASPQHVPGSLYFGGYDQNRAVNTMLAVSMGDSYGKFSDAPLIDISINVVKGESPFPWSNKGGLLAAGNSSMEDRLSVDIDPCFPYLNLPKSTCDAIANEIPVTYSEDLGLYFWDTDSPDYVRIVKSPSVLQFTFINPDNNKQPINISVPFMHLNLTLEQPLVDQPTPYFPCNAVSNGNYALGRAFLQDAFFGANLATGIYFLSQAPGPNINGESLMTMSEDCTQLDTSHNDWEISWDETWEPIQAQVNQTSQTPQTPPSDSPKRNTATATIAGAAVGGVAGAIFLVLFGFIIWRHQRSGQGFSLCGLPLIKDKSAVYRNTNVMGTDEPKSLTGYSARGPPQELSAYAGYQLAEMPTSTVVHEMSPDYSGRSFILEEYSS
ncbi:hypothetical protein F5Y13DRAFT_181310 [Hypoxylon sp. FL1857]|nr:hypothetical protein F5Y13DRAFT_181310 [Hypoxylon sp. FL1857]